MPKRISQRTKMDEESWASSSSNDDDDGDEDFKSEEKPSSSEESDPKPSQRRSRKTAATTTQTSQTATSRLGPSRRARDRRSVLEFSENEEALDSSSEEQVAQTRGRRPTSRSTIAAKPRATKKKQPVASRTNRKKPVPRAEDSSTSDDSDSDSLPAYTRNSKQRAAASKNKKQQTSIQTTRTRGRRAATTNSDGESESESSEDNAVGTVTPQPNRSNTRRGQRSSARKAQDRMNALLKDSSSSSDESSVEPTPQKKPTRKRKTNADDEDEFVVDEDEVDENDNLSDSLSDDDIDTRNVSAANIDNEVIGTADDSSSGDETPTQRPKTWSSNTLSPALQEITPSQKTIYSSSDESEQRPAARLTTSQLPDCPSTTDPITAENLPKRHVCFISRDGSRQCFALSTLHTVAITASSKRYREHFLGGEQVQTFLQPPHFRTPMSDDMLDQIASRFGREALEVNGPFYNRPPPSPNAEAGEDSDDSEDYGLHRALADNEEFLKQVQGYAKAQMGSRDLYVCPICYCVAQDTFCEKNPFKSKSKSKKSSKKKALDLDGVREKYLGETRLQDPMAVLKVLDKRFTRELEIASTFSSTKVSEIKKHIRTDHHLKTAGIQGNDLYSRYRMREQDGLLQRYLFNRSGHLSQGSMMKYWNSLGNNFSYVHLMCLVDRAQILAAINKDSEDNVNEREREEARKYWDRANEYFASFSGISEKLWQLLSEPYRRSSGGDLNDFLADDAESNSDGGDEAETHQAYLMDSFRKKQQEEDEQDKLWVERLQSEFKEDDEQESEADALSDAEESESEEESDDSAAMWQRELEQKRRKAAPKQAAKKKHRRVQPMSQDDSESEVEFGGDNDGSVKQREIVVLDDSDDDLQNKTPTKRRRRILDDDDD